MHAKTSLFSSFGITNMDLVFFISELYEGQAKIFLGLYVGIRNGENRLSFLLLI
jgi:hypothetical protein